MAVIIHTDDPDSLLEKIYEAIDQKKADKWTSTPDGKLTPGTLLWKNEAFFVPQIWVEENQLRFGLLKRKDRRHISTKLYTIFHTKLIEMLLGHFDRYFYCVSASSGRDEPDNF